MRALKQRFQFVFVIVLFFPVIIEALFKLANSSEGSPKVVLQWGVIVALFLMSYLLLEFLGKTIGTRTALLVNATLILEVVAFIPVILILAGIANNSVPVYMAPLYQGSLIACLCFPIAMFFILGAATGMKIGDKFPLGKIPR